MIKPRRVRRVWPLIVTAVLGTACANQPATTASPAPTISPISSPTASQTAALSPSPVGTSTALATSPSPTSDPLNLAQGTAQGVSWKLVLKPGNPVCLELQPASGPAGSIVCDEESEQDFTGDQRMRYSFGGVNESQVLKFVFGFTVPEVTRVSVEGGEGNISEGETRSSSAVPGRRFFAVPVEPAPTEVRSIRGLNQAGQTVAGFRFGPPDEPPSPLTG